MNDEVHSAIPTAGIRFASIRLMKIVLFSVILLLLTAPATAQRTAPSGDLPAKSADPKTVAAIGRLYELHFWTGKSYSLKDDANRQAIIAFQKLSGLPRNGRLTDSTEARIMRARTPTARAKLHQPHIEVDLDHQVLLVVDGADSVNRILPVSTGNGQQFDYPGKGPEYARTPRGHFKIFYKVTGWKKSPLGKLLHPMYFSGGFAVHGAGNVPAKPASHGCIRIPIFAAEEMFRVTPIGTPIIVYGENPKPKPDDQVDK